MNDTHHTLYYRLLEAGRFGNLFCFLAYTKSKHTFSFIIQDFFSLVTLTWTCNLLMWCQTCSLVLKHSNVMFHQQWHLQQNPQTFFHYFWRYIWRYILCLYKRFSLFFLITCVSLMSHICLCPLLASSPMCVSERERSGVQGTLQDGERVPPGQTWDRRAWGPQVSPAAKQRDLVLQW